MTQPTWIGKNIGGRYLIEAELGQGGMASVYKATDPNLKRIVAVKLIHTHLSKTQEFVRRFEAEAAAVAQLRHPHIVQVFDFNHDGEVYFIVFEFVPGETLQDRLKRLRESRRQMALNNVIKYAIQVGDALSYAHSRDLVHRDVKPLYLTGANQGTKSG
jgi:serine/threonine protein kinase